MPAALFLVGGSRPTWLARKIDLLESLAGSEASPATELVRVISPAVGHAGPLMLARVAQGQEGPRATSLAAQGADCIARPFDSVGAS